MAAKMAAKKGMKWMRGGDKESKSKLARKDPDAAGLINTEDVGPLGAGDDGGGHFHGHSVSPRHRISRQASSHPTSGPALSWPASGLNNTQHRPDTNGMDAYMLPAAGSGLGPRTAQRATEVPTAYAGTGRGGRQSEGGHYRTRGNTTDYTSRESPMYETRFPDMTRIPKASEVDSESNQRSPALPARPGEAQELDGTTESPQDGGMTSYTARKWAQPVGNTFNMYNGASGYGQVAAQAWDGSADTAEQRTRTPSQPGDSGADLESQNWVGKTMLLSPPAASQGYPAHRPMSARPPETSRTEVLGIGRGHGAAQGGRRADYFPSAAVAAVMGPTAGQQEQEAARLLMSHNVTLSPSMSAISGLLQWVPEQLKAVNERARKLDEQNQETTSLVDALAKDNKRLRADVATWMADAEASSAESRRVLGFVEDRERLLEEVRSLRGDNTYLQDDNKKLQQQLSACMTGFKQAEGKWKSKLDEQERAHKANQAEMEKQHTAATHLMQAQHDNEMDLLKDHNDGLKLRIASYSKEEYIAIPDDKLKFWFKDIARRIDRLCREVHRQEGSAAGETLDRNGFLSRVVDNRGWPRFVHSVCWEVLLRGFFAYPLGLGAMGSQGRGYEVLYALYQTKAAQDANGTAPVSRLEARRLTRHLDAPGRNLVLPVDKDTNIWRAGTFASILDKITGQHASSSDALVLGAAFWANVENVAQELTGVLQRLCGGTLNSRDPEEIARDTGLLALRMAAQRAHILISTCAYGECILQPGVEFKCEGNVSMNAKVDIMTKPALKHVGDGHEDLTTTKVIEQGEFVALKEDAQIKLA